MDESGLVIVQRLHRMVRHGYRPWLGYAPGEDRDIQLRRKDNIAMLHPDGSVSFATPVRPGVTAIAAEDAAGFDAVFTPGAPNRRNIVRRLYEIGFLAS